jgi:hypothetical protein
MYASGKMRLEIGIVPPQKVYLYLCVLSKLLSPMQTCAPQPNLQFPNRLCPTPKSKY